MKEMINNSLYFGIFISLLAYGVGAWIKAKFKFTILNPLLISVAIIIMFLVFTDTSYETYNEGAKYISYFLTPATVCLAIPLYEQLEALKKNMKAIMIGISSGVIAALVSIFLFALAFNFNNQEYVTFLPKSITTAIGMPLSEELGGIGSITVVAIMITGLTGNILAVPICKLFKITNPIAVGVSIGTSSHALGTTKAMELGEIEGAMSSLSIAVAGLLTVVGSTIFAKFI